MSLTGLPDQPLGPPDGLVEGIDRLARSFPRLDGLALLSERAACMGLWRRGATSCGGSCRLLPTADGFMAVSLPRVEDMEAVPAWLELDVTPSSVPAMWSAVASNLRHGDPPVLLERAELLGLPVAMVAQSADQIGVRRSSLGDAPPPARPHRTGRGRPLGAVGGPAVWRPPCLHRRHGAQGRVDTATRRVSPRPARFFDLLNGRKRSVALDFKDRDDVRILHELVRRADIVIEASRPRALAQLGLDGPELVRNGGTRLWVSITGYGRASNRVAFGDDAAASGGLVVWKDQVPLFCADAVADPVTGLTAADACLEALASGGRWLLDVSMSAVSATLAGPTLHAPRELAVAHPRARPVVASAPALGADTARTLSELGIV